MSTGVLILVGDDGLRGDVDRVAAAVGARVVHADEPSSHKVWTSAAAVVLDDDALARCLPLGLPRRGGVHLVTAADPSPAQWQRAMSLGVERIVRLPDEEADLVAALSDAGESPSARGRGAVVAVLGGRGGAGASVFAAALAMGAGEALLVDLDPWGGGLDLIMGGEAESGLRWPDLTLGGGRLGYRALRDALPRCGDVGVLSAGRVAREIDGRAASAVLDAGSRGGATVVCDLARRPSEAIEVVLDAADLVVVIACADLRACASTAAVAGWAAERNANVGLVVRGPSPGGLRGTDVAEIGGLPLLATMRPQPRLAYALEHGGLAVRPRSPLAMAAQRVLGVLRGHPQHERVA
ncbi:septum site-determining protein Ssd [Mycolicibacterium grossiae]|uniref:AAA family ATPase n=1 Tax=Mycolicibacterium grossiae TaxID=1552759 RepID=A0A1E8Q5E9_9MYCO|nr:septum site-determining protein Ssd [Mycolicibacterium grossiae]OFJ53842.1 AAA family ATPase [Mycolicibacterium grossiae]QEM43965.1 AAA family ATPase [Mycolicibacterium grossiae]